MVIVITDGEGPAEAAAKRVISALNIQNYDMNLRLVFRLCTDNIHTMTRWQQLREDNSRKSNSNMDDYSFSYVLIVISFIL